MPEQTTQTLVEPTTPPAEPRLASVLASLSFRRISALYIFAVIFVVFSIWVPDTFLAWSTWRALIDAQAITAIAAIGLLVAVSAGAFDLAVGAELGLGGIFVAWLLVNRGMPLGVAIPLTLAAGGAVGLFTGLTITVARVDSFIATLGVSSILLAVISWVSGDQQILNVSPSLQRIGTSTFLSLTWPVWIMVGVAAAVWYLLERTPAGRRIYATGGNADAARLAGVNTRRVVILSMVCCGVIAALSGLLLTATIGAGDPTVGPPYLLPVFTAVFLGSTQFREGRFNVLGTVVVVYVLAVGVKGFQLAGAPTWLPDLFNGVALLVAVAMAQYQGRTRERHALLALLRLDRRSRRGREHTDA